MNNLPSILFAICHECLREFELVDDYLIGDSKDIWECPHCCYPNSKNQLEPYEKQKGDSV